MSVDKNRLFLLLQKPFYLISQITNIQFSWLELVANAFFVGYHQDNDHGYNFINQKKNTVFTRKGN